MNIKDLVVIEKGEHNLRVGSIGMITDVLDSVEHPNPLGKKVYEVRGNSALPPHKPMDTFVTEDEVSEYDSR